MKKKKAFTLVELLAVIVVLAIILVIAVPQIMNAIKESRKGALISSAKLIAGTAETTKISNDTLGIEREITCENVSSYAEEDYTCDLRFENNKPYVTLVGHGKFEGMYVCDATKENAVVTFESCSLVKLSVELNGGSDTVDYEEKYEAGSNVTIETPTKVGNTFAGWTVTGEGSSFDENSNVLTIGTEDVTLTANWTINTYTISYNLNGGTNAEGNPTSGEYGTTVTINNPTRTGYTFAGWNVTGKGSSFDENSNVLTIGTEDVTLTAKWTASTYTITYNLNGGTNASGNPKSGTNGTTVTINNPTRTGYSFAGWTVTGASLNDNKLTMGASNVILTANWRLETAVKKIESLYATTPNTEGLIMDDFGNIRYAGSSPKNYIKFNDELWRIIGLFKVKTASGTTEKLVKIVRDTQFSIEMSWDSSSVNYGFGVNEWSQADLMTMLNTYYIRTSTKCRYCKDTNESTCSNDCSSSVTPIGNAYTSMIENVVWNTGAFEWNDNGVTVGTSYKAERGTTTGKICTSVITECNDTVARKTTWQGKVGLIYPSDYGYASTDTSCRANIINYSNQPCKNNNWLHSGSSYWTLSPSAYSSSAYFTCFVNSRGYVYDGGGCNDFGVRPAIYLKSNVSITSGDGSSGLPYQISMN